ncbi:MAG: transporter substrate-binding domain-containing protein [Nocardioidaceae bacterium]
MVNTIIRDSKRRWPIVAAAAAALLALSGCAVGAGGSSSDSPGADKYDTIESGKLTFAMSGEYRPFNYYDEDSNLVGFDVEIANEIADRMGLEPNPVTGPFNTLLAGLAGGRYDTVIGSMSVTPEREQQADFSQKYYSAGAQLFVEEGSSITSIEDLRDANVGVALGTTFEDYANDQSNVDKVTTYQADIQAMREVESGRLDAAIASKPMGLYQIKEAGLDVEPVGDVLFPDVAAIPVAKGNTELLDGINEALSEIKADGTYLEISKKWFGRDIG